ncbi:MAG: DEAD/DEAH box helicase family protein, partial [Lachnospiraceae bacterium]|nr:DEAD/DEAH box helicase family protein [Lachnospiraceae bacterium]
HGKQFYEYMYHEYLQADNDIVNQVLSREGQKQFLHDMAVSRIWEKPLSVPRKPQKTENLSKEKIEVIKSQEQSKKRETEEQREKQKENQNKKELISQEKAPFAEQFNAISENLNEKDIVEETIESKSDSLLSVEETILEEDDFHQYKLDDLSITTEHSQNFNEKQTGEQEVLYGELLDKNGDIITTFPKEIPVNTDENTKENFYFSNRLPRGSAKTRYQWNIEAIRLLKEIESTNRFATYKEKNILARYVGWGGIPQVFDEKNEQWKNEFVELKSLLSESEYKNARESVNTAFYTSPDIIEAIYQGISKLGFKKGTILEPALGVGHFSGAMPEDMRESKFYGVEKDNISGKIAKLLYPKATINICGFEETQFSDNFFDVAIGNIPFGDFQVFDKNYAKNYFLIHDYFVAKSLDKVRPGGIVAFITSKGTMDKANPSVRKYFAERAELLGAIRLPNTAFRDSAGTDVTSDILFFQKREKKIVTEPNWIHLGQTEDGIPINSYFVEHPEMMLGKMEYDNRMFGKESRYTTCVNHNTDFDLKQALLQAVSNIQGQITDIMEYIEDMQPTKEYDILDAEPNIKNYTYTFVNGNLYYRENSKMYPVEVSETIKERIRLMDKIRSATRKLIAIQTEGCTEQELKQQQNILNTVYDMYHKKYGAITARGSRMAFQEDADYPLLCSLEISDEDGNVKKADMFYKQTIRPNKHTDHVETASEALHISIREFGFVNIPFMADIYQPNINRISENSSFEENITRTDFNYPPYKSLTSQEEMEEKINNLSMEMRGTLEETELKRKQLIEELKGLIFADPEEYHSDNPYEGWKTADEYLSGNVRHKLRIAKAYAMQNGELFAQNVHALEQVQPKDLEATEIEVRIGTTWIETEDYEKFLYELLGTPRRVQAVRNKYQNSGVQVKYNEYTQNWFIENKSLDKSSIAATKTYGTGRINAYSIMEECLNLRTVTVRDRIEDKDGTVSYQVNQRETMLAREKQTQMKEAFKNWIFKEPNRRKKYVEYYNNTFNNIRLREYDGSYLTFPGMNPDIHLRKHQKNAISRILLGGNTLLAHVVGAGKSYTMMAACMEQKRLGLANKTVMVVPKPLIGQAAGEFMRLYPSANILVATERDFEKSRRQQFVSRIATGNYDCIIMSHSQFERIPISAERKERMLNKQIEEMSHAIEELKRQNGERWSVKQMESQKNKLEHQLKVLSDESKKDDLICFEELGIDSMMVDEAHHFKNCAIFSKINNVSGISATGSQKATDMQLKCQYLTETYGNRGIVFATGTPVSNSMCELYVMQRYLQKDALERMGIYHFDAWAANFGEVTTALELSVEGSGFRFKSRFNKFTNLPELMTLFKDVADVQTADMLSLPVPTLKGGKYNIVESEPDWYVKQVMEDFVVRAERIRNGTVDPTVDNFLKITGEARLLGTDARLLEANAPENIDGKLNKVIENVTAEYFQNNQNGKIGCQLVFSDIGTPKSTWTKDWEQLFKNGKRQFDVYNYIKTELVKRNIPSEEIAYIHDAKSDAQREELFREMRTGKKKILIGSTDQCGTGVNVQTHLVALHHTDCPWKPSSIEQREGRGIRQGNENKEVAIYRYVTKGTFDAYMWGIVENKQRFISQVMTSKSVSRNCEDIDEATLSYAEIKAVATGNPLIKEKMQLENEVQRLKLLKNSYDSQKYTLEDNILIRYPKLIAAAKEKIKCVEEDITKAEANLLAEPDFSITIGNIKYKERVDAGTVFLKAVNDCKISEITPIGMCKGFEVLAEKNYTGVNCMILRGKSEYKAEISTSPVGNMVKLENLLSNIPQHLDSLKKKLEEYKRDLEQSKSEYQKPFEQEHELKEKIARLDKLNIQLDLENRNLSDEAFENEKEEKKVAEQYIYKTR